MEDIKFVEASEVKLVDVLGSDLAVARAAVVSTGLSAEEWPIDRVNGLINRLMKDRHGVPFEHVLFTFMVRTPVFTARQLMRHRLASWNEASARYRVIPAEFYVPSLDRPVRQEGKAMEYKFHEDQELARDVQMRIENVSRHAYYAYQSMIDVGVAREVARMVLPTNVMTEVMVTINLRSLFNLLSLRGKGEGLFPSHPQHEIVQVAEQMELAVAIEAPGCHQAFVGCGRVAP